MAGQKGATPDQNVTATPEGTSAPDNAGTPEGAPAGTPDQTTPQATEGASNAATPEGASTPEGTTTEKSPVRIANLDPVALRIGLSAQRTRNLTKETDDNGVVLLRTTTVTIPGTDGSIVIIPEDAVTEYLERRDLPSTDPRSIKTRISGKDTASYTAHVPLALVDAFETWCKDNNVVIKKKAASTPEGTNAASTTNAATPENQDAENTRRANALAGVPAS